jgi:hypothetical protein
MALLIAASMMGLLSFAWVLGRLRVELVAAKSPGDSVIFLSQGWSKEVREGYYHISQAICPAM